MPALSHTEEARLVREARTRSRTVGLHLTALLIGGPLLLALDFGSGHGPFRGWSIVAGVIWVFALGVQAVQYRWWRQERVEDIARARRTLLNRFAGTPDPGDTGADAASDEAWLALAGRCRAGAERARQELPGLREGLDLALAALEPAGEAALAAHHVLAGAGPGAVEEIDRQIAQLDKRVSRKGDARLQELYNTNRERLVARRDAVVRAAATREALHGAASDLARALEAEELQRDAISQALGSLRRALARLP